MKKGMKFLFNRAFRYPAISIFCGAALIALIVLVIVFHEPISSDDYLICKFFLHFATILFMMCTGIFLCTNISGNRAVRSSPIAKALHLYCIPMYNSILTVSLTTLMNIIYTVFILIAGHDLANLSDMLVLSAPVCAVLILICTTAMYMRWGMILMIYAYFPIAGFMFFVPGTVWKFGFGLPIWASLLIYIGAAIVSVALSFVIGRLFYRFGDFKAVQQQQVAP